MKFTRRMISAVHNQELNDASFHKVGAFKLCVPYQIEGVPSEILNPRNTWANKEAYDHKEAELVNLYVDNFKKFEALCSEPVINAGPVLYKMA